MNDADIQLYNRALIQLSEKTSEPKRLPRADATATAVSPICGSIVTVDITVDSDQVTGFGYEVEACALTKAVVAVMADKIIGKTRADIAAAGAALKSMLAGGPVPGGEWADLQILGPVADYKARHNAILLPFEAVEKAFTAALT